MQRFISLNGDKVIYYDEDDERASRDYRHTLSWNDNNFDAIPLNAIYDNNLIKDCYQFFNMYDDLARFIEQNDLEYC